MLKQSEFEIEPLVEWIPYVLNICLYVYLCECVCQRPRALYLMRNSQGWNCYKGVLIADSTDKRTA